MSYHQPPPGPPQPEHFAAPQQKRRRPGTKMLITGLIMLGVSIIGGIIAIGAFAVGMVNSFEKFADTTYEITEPVTVDGLGDNHWYIYQDPGAMTSITCDVSDEQGQNITDQSSSMDVATNDFAYEAFQSFESAAQGSYEIDCTDYPVVLGGAVPFGSIIGMGVSIVLAVLLFLAGAVLTIIGLVQRSRATNQQMPPNGPHYGSGPNPGYGYPPPPQHPGQQPPN